jgi:hypothetical protein
MKSMRKLLIMFIAGLTIGSTFSQDIITKKSGEDIQSKILEVSTTEVKYKKFDNQIGPTFSISKSDILMIRYENGSKDIFNENSSNSNSDLCIQGQQDSKQNYTGKISGAGWTCATTILLSPLIGVIPGAICASTEPSDGNLNIYKPELMKDSNYNRCYKEQAHKTKKKKVWGNFGAGSCVWLVLILLI